MGVVKNAVMNQSLCLSLLFVLSRGIVVAHLHTFILLLTPVESCAPMNCWCEISDSVMLSCNSVSSECNVSILVMLDPLL